MVPHGANEADDCDDEQKHAAGDDATHDAEAGDDGHRLAVRSDTYQDQPYQLK